MKPVMKQKHIEHLFDSNDYLIQNLKCIYCNLYINDITAQAKLNLSLTQYQSYTFRMMINSVPCITKDEFIIKSIIE